jgi:GTPase Era involved in 16S rRNA processing
MLVTKAWDTLEDSDHVLFVVDGAKWLSFEVKEAIKRLNTVSLDP